ncbi:hypothetical protein PR202_ga27428 [Eleusine coracana subsp. coracana]|uniref:Small nuclear RNA activating complex (SNAPc), subunit SNAP43 n=1 Tax=Eleusine coracana subsp. coracana TaxID=191504 RepID=A0AAV5DFY3_ELECO|nr:hypothetical protein PR202_ga27428 [Eleusine coracana subsp. coracana]
MDLAPFKLDIDELLTDYARVLFPQIFYVSCHRPMTNSGVFMQSLFLHCIGHMTSQSLLPQRLAGLYCLYCLYECQPYKPRFKIYLSLEECKQLKDFVVMAKQNELPLVPVLVKRMLDKGMFLFGFINLLGDNGEKQVEELTASQNKRVKFASDKLFANTQLESYMHMDLGAEFELDSIKKLSKEYAEAKELALAEASQTIDVEDARHILQNDKLLGDRVDEVVKEWDAQKEEFYEKTGLSRGNELAVMENDESGVLRHDDDGFDEITQLLLE